MRAPDVLSASASEVIDLLAGAGVRAHTDPRDMDPPCAWISPQEITYPTLAGHPAHITWEVYLIVPDTGAPLAHMGDLIARTATVLPGLTMRTLGLTVPSLSPDPLPAATFTVETEVQP